MTARRLPLPFISSIFCSVAIVRCIAVLVGQFALKTTEHEKMAWRGAARLLASFALSAKITR